MPTQTYRIAFWNVENLFAPENHPGREPWIADAMRQELSGWTAALFERKLDQLTRVIAAMHGGAGPDLLGVCEVENRFVLDRLIAKLATALPGRSYDAVHVDATRDHRGIDTAFLYDTQRLSTVPAEVFSHFVMRRTGTRDITQATFRTPAGREFVALMNHWPSRSGGAETSRGFRMTAGETLGYWHERIREKKGADVAVIAGGDFNDEPFDPSMTIHANSTRERGDVERARSAKFYNLALRYLSTSTTDAAGTQRMVYGTLYFDDNGNVFDQMLVSPGLLKSSSPVRVEEGSVGMEFYPPMVSPRAAAGPIRFGLPKGNAAQNVDQDGYSDHYPVAVTIEIDS